MKHGGLRSLALMLAGVACVLLLAGRAAAAPAVDRKEVTACGHPIYPPISWLESGEIRGAAPALVKRVFESLGYKVRLTQEGNWRRCLKEAETGDIDIVVGLYKIASRERYIAFSQDPTIKKPIVLFYSKDHPMRFDSWEDLRGKRIGMLFGDTFGDEADAKIAHYMNVERVSSGMQNFGKLVNGRIDVMPLGIAGGMMQAKKFGYQDKVDYLDRPLVIESWYVGISQKSPLVRHLPHLNSELKRLKESGEVESLMTQFSDEYIKSPVRH